MLRMTLQKSMSAFAWFRFFRVLFSDCVPVLLNDFYAESSGLLLVPGLPCDPASQEEPPFGEIFDASAFTVRWPMRHVGAVPGLWFRLVLPLNPR